MEYAPGGDMFQYVKQRNGLQASPLAAMVMHALNHLWDTGGLPVLFRRGCSVHKTSRQCAAAASCWALLVVRLLWPCMHCSKFGPLVACVCCATGTAQGRTRCVNQLQHHVRLLLSHKSFCSREGLIDPKLLVPLLIPAPELHFPATLQLSSQRQLVVAGV